MQENFLEEFNETSGKIYSSKSILWGTFLAGFAAGAYMLYQNFKSFGQTEKARMIVIGAIASFAFLTFSLFSPVLDNIPGFVYSVFFTLMANFVILRYQKQLINVLIEKGGEFQSSGNVIIVCIVAIIVIIILFGAILYYTGNLSF